MSVEPAWMQANWGNLAMVSWLVDPALVQGKMPPGCTLDLWEGAAALSLVGVEFSNVVVKGIRWPWHNHFPELNLRTYAQGPQGPGVVFLGELVPKLLVARMARGIYGEPYENGRIWLEKREGGREPEVAYVWGPGAGTFRFSLRAEARPMPVGKGTLEEFLLDRSRGYNRFRGGTTYKVMHQPWTMRAPLHYAVDGATGAPFGPDFGPVLQGAAASVLFSDGSAVQVGYPARMGA
ncbi:MAG: DUF2071 domain-containing protein [Verrucomicrobia bacterium]|nr:DUF2071 domain-containing protein [Verrucomicrobiota bacterium]